MKKLLTKQKSPLILYGKTSNNKFYNPFYTIQTSHTSTLFTMLSYKLSPAYIKTKHSIVFTGHKIYEDFNYVYFKENYRCKKKLISDGVSVYRVVSNCEAVPYVPMKDEIGYVYSRMEIDGDRFLRGIDEMGCEYVVDGVRVVVKRINFGRIMSVRLVVDGWMRGYVQIGDVIDGVYEYEVVKECDGGNGRNDDRVNRGDGKITIGGRNDDKVDHRDETGINNSEKETRRKINAKESQINGNNPGHKNVPYQYKYVVHKEGVTGVFLSNKKYLIKDKVRLKVHRFDDGRYLFKEDDSVDLSVAWTEECTNKPSVAQNTYRSTSCQLSTAHKNEKVPHTCLPDITVHNLQAMEMPAFKRKLKKYKRHLQDLKDVFTGEKNIEVYKQIFLMLRTRRSYIEYIQKDSSAFLEYPKYYHIGISVLEDYDRWFERINRTKKVWLAYLKRTGNVGVQRCLEEMRGKEREFFVGYFRSAGLLNAE
ncbi:hypothetical protein THOM_2711 [Trachipleistophora hominis]|uniref:Uncharacterized protein n=1 Tax=Trachipleistophora hominis TaxID=72359 RepID=L7JS93_TRAHO|nr:hypothetical protein THOM_2711 [Trachipleistophora hominis]